MVRVSDKASLILVQRCCMYVESVASGSLGKKRTMGMKTGGLSWSMKERLWRRRWGGVGEEGLMVSVESTSISNVGMVDLVLQAKLLIER